MGSSKNDYSDLFDDDFEVTYEEDPGLTLDMYSSARKKKTAHTALEDTDPDMDFEDDSYDDFEDVDEDSDMIMMTTRRIMIHGDGAGERTAMTMKTAAGTPADAVGKAEAACRLQLRSRRAGSSCPGSLALCCASSL